jgi:hypothetical protein
VFLRPFVAPHLKAPSTHPFDKNGFKCFVNQPKFELGPHKKCVLEMEMDASKIHSITKISAMSYWNFLLNFFKTSLKHQPQDAP